MGFVGYQFEGNAPLNWSGLGSQSESESEYEIRWPTKMDSLPATGTVPANHHHNVCYVMAPRTKNTNPSSLLIELNLDTDIRLWSPPFNGSLLS